MSSSYSPDGSRIARAESADSPAAEPAASEEDEEDEEEGDTVVADGNNNNTTTASGSSGGGGVGGGAGADGVIRSKIITTIKSLESLEKEYREVGKEALCWQTSSAKPGNGIDQLRDGSTETYWQSDGTTQPHWIQVHFARRIAISHVCLYLDYGLDESYTPKRLEVHVGMTNQDLLPAIHPNFSEIELKEPSGWCVIPLSPIPDPLDDVEEMPSSSSSSSTTKVKGVCAHLIRISISAMHQNGRDTHVRQVRLYTPRTEGLYASGSSGIGGTSGSLVVLPFRSTALLQKAAENRSNIERQIDITNNNNNNTRVESESTTNSWDDENDLAGLSLGNFPVIR